MFRKLAMALAAVMLVGCGAHVGGSSGISAGILPAPVNATALRASSLPNALRTFRVESPTQFTDAVTAAIPGDQIVLANGNWVDFDALLEAEGTAEAPVQLIAETPGKVILSGQSSLRLAGNYLLVSGLVFKNGYTPRSEVISFRKDTESTANNSRVTSTVIEGYSNPDRTQRDSLGRSIREKQHVRFQPFVGKAECRADTGRPPKYGGQPRKPPQDRQ